ncbi:MAG: 4a-hydroxytetrahydrobiopterin dehydratase [Propionibacteriaceae bacterium]|nr:4a-hydroxytetrahydrobiopterin dehydratase [Propionibacteriaceae bacterium]
MSERLKISDVLAADLPDWRMLLDALYATFQTGSFTAGLALVQRITDLAEAANHHPDVLLTYPRVEVKLFSHDTGGVTDRDLALARQISEAAAAAGHAARTSQTIIEFGLDTTRTREQAEFWAVACDSSVIDDDEVACSPRAPSLWFQPSDEPLAQRWHPDIWVPHDQAEERVAAVLAAGGVLVDETYAPAWWVLADPDGNRFCICTSLERAKPNSDAPGDTADTNSD